MLNFEIPKLKLGIAYTRRDTWMNKSTEKNRSIIADFLNKSALDLEFEIYSNDTLDASRKRKYINGREVLQSNNKFLTDYQDAISTAEYFRKCKIDALFIAFCNYGQEEAIAKLAKELNVPVLLWAPIDQIDNENDVYRSTDAQCGIFAASKVLRRYGVKYTFIENCDIKSNIFLNGLKQFISSARIVKNFRSGRIAQISVRPQQFVNLMVNEGELLEKFGIEVVPVTGVELLDSIKDSLKKEEEIRELLEDIETEIDLSQVPNKEVLAAIELGYIKIAKRYSCNAIASDCWHTVRREFGFGPWFVFGDLYDRGLPCTNECDIHGAITSLIALGALNNSSPAFLSDLTMKNPEDNNSELLWHMGFAKSLKDPRELACVVPTGEGNYRLKNGELTILRFDGDNGYYSCFVGHGQAIYGPKTGGNYTYLKVDNWSKWEHKFVYGPYVHHVVGMYGDHRAAIKESLHYLNIKADNPESNNYIPF